MAVETNKINYGGDIMLFVNGTPIAFSNAAKLDVTLTTRDISSKDSGYWEDKAAGKLTWTASSDALMCDSDLLGNAAITLAGAASITSGAAVLTVVGAGFASTDVGRSVTVIGAGAGATDLVTTISVYTSATQVTLANTAGTTVTAQANRFKWNASTSTYSTLYTLMSNRTPTAMVFASTTGAAPNWTVSTATGKSRFTGTGIITSLSLNVPDNDSGTYSVSLEGTGALTMIA